MQKELPAGWKWVKLGDVCEITSSKRVYESQWQSEGIPFYRARELVEIKKNGYVDNDLFISNDMYEEYAKRYGVPNKGDILVTGVGTLGITYVVKNKDTFYFKDGNIIWLKLSEAVEPSYLEHIFASPSLREQIEKTTGTTVKTLTIVRAKSLSIPLPPLGEQKRIAGILNEQMAAVEEAKKAAQERLEAVKALPAAYLREVFPSSEDELPEGWKWVKLGDVCEIARGGSPRPISGYLTNSENGVNWVKIADATRSNKYIFETEEKIIEAGVRYSRLVQSGDFLLSNSMSFGRPYIMRTSGCIHDGWLVLSSYESSFNQDFLYYLLGSSSIYSEFKKLSAGSTVKNLNIQIVSRVSVPLLPLEEQKRISSELDDKIAGVKLAEASIQQELDTIEAMPAALLRKAFSGGL